MAMPTFVHPAGFAPVPQTKIDMALGSPTAVALQEAAPAGLATAQAQDAL